MSSNLFTSTIGQRVHQKSSRNSRKKGNNPFDYDLNKSSNLKFLSTITNGKQDRVFMRRIISRFEKLQNNKTQMNEHEYKSNVDELQNELKSYIHHNRLIEKANNKTLDNEIDDYLNELDSSEEFEGDRIRQISDDEYDPNNDADDEYDPTTNLKEPCQESSLYVQTSAWNLANGKAFIDDNILYQSDFEYEINSADECVFIDDKNKKRKKKEKWDYMINSTDDEDLQQEIQTEKSDKFDKLFNLLKNNEVCNVSFPLKLFFIIDTN